MGAMAPLAKSLASSLRAGCQGQVPRPPKGQLMSKQYGARAIRLTPKGEAYVRALRVLRQYQGGAEEAPKHAKAPKKANG